MTSVEFAPGDISARPRRRMYDADEVDAYLNSLQDLVSELETAIEVARTRARPSRPLDPSGASEAMLAHILIRAQRSADDIVSTARAQASEVLRVADEQAEATIARAQIEVATYVIQLRAAIRAVLGQCRHPAGSLHAAPIEDPSSALNKNIQPRRIKYVQPPSMKDGPAVEAPLASVAPRIGEWTVQGRLSLRTKSHHRISSPTVTVSTHLPHWTRTGSSAS